MSKVYTGASMSLDGYIASPADPDFEHLFRWYGSGDVAVPTADPQMTMQMTAVGAQHVRDLFEMTGALVVGRTLFDQVDGWGGNHPIGAPVVVLTHSVPDGWPRDDAPTHFVHDGIEAAVDLARQLAGDKDVGVNGGVIARQCLDAGLLDEIWVDLVPVLLGGGTPFFEALGSAPVALEGPISVTPDSDVTHLRYGVRR